MPAALSVRRRHASLLVCAALRRATISTRFAHLHALNSVPYSDEYASNLSQGRDGHEFEHVDGHFENFACHFADRLEYLLAGRILDGGLEAGLGCGLGDGALRAFVGLCDLSERVRSGRAGDGPYGSALAGWCACVWAMG